MKYLWLFIIVFVVMSCSKEESSSSCDDGIQNGIETGVDCGGDCPQCELPLEGVYQGELRLLDPDDGEFRAELKDVRVVVEECSPTCVDVTFITPGVSTNTIGTFSKSSTFYSLDLNPVYEDPNDIKPWEMDWPRGTGNFDWINNELIINLQVDDSHAAGGTEVAYFYIGEQ